MTNYLTIESTANYPLQSEDCWRESTRNTEPN